MAKKKFKYKIFEGTEPKDGSPLYQVIGVDNEYVGEWHKDKSIAEKELSGLNSKTLEKEGVVDGHKLIYEIWSDQMGGDGVSGTIRTHPQNYYVATVQPDGDLMFEELEGKTKNIDTKEVSRLWKENKIPLNKKIFKGGGEIKVGDKVKMFEDEPNMVVTKINEWADKGNTYDLESEDGSIKRQNISYTKILSTYSDGGGIPNNYEGKSAKEVWEEWSEKQRLHFLKDHKEHIAKHYGSTPAVLKKFSKKSFEELEKDFRMIVHYLNEHIEEGQYADGGGVKSRGMASVEDTRLHIAYADENWDTLSQEERNELRRETYTHRMIGKKMAKEKANRIREKKNKTSNWFKEGLSFLNW